MRLVLRLCWDFALCQVGKESSIYITSHEAGPGPGEQRIRLYLQTQRETNPHLLKITKWLWIIITTHYSTAELYHHYRHALLHGRTITFTYRHALLHSRTITIATRYSTAELYHHYRHALLHSRTITVATRYSMAEILQLLWPRATPRPKCYNHYRHALLHGLFTPFFYFILRVHEALIWSARVQPSSYASCFSAVSSASR